MVEVTDKIGQIVDQIKMGRQVEKCVNRLVGWTNKQQIEFRVRKASGHECGEMKVCSRSRSKSLKTLGILNLYKQDYTWILLKVLLVFNMHAFYQRSFQHIWVELSPEKYSFILKIPSSYLKTQKLHANQSENDLAMSWLFKILKINRNCIVFPVL